MEGFVEAVYKDRNRTQNVHLQYNERHCTVFLLSLTLLTAPRLDHQLVLTSVNYALLYLPSIAIACSPFNKWISTTPGMGVWHRDLRRQIDRDGG